MTVDTLVKIGGSLLRHPNKLRPILDAFVSDKSFNKLFSVGSGPLGDEYKVLRKAFSADVTHASPPIDGWSYIQTINAHLLLCLNGHLRPCSGLKELRHALDVGQPGVVLSHTVTDLFTQESIQTSDYRAAILCSAINAPRLIVLTDVPGLFDKDPQKYGDAARLYEIDSRSVEAMTNSCVDSGVASYAKKAKLQLYVAGIEQIDSYNGQIDLFLTNEATHIRD
ncbi:MAG: hypothetical protein ACQEVT_18540 [Pseudomonadota bacterium]